MANHAAVFRALGEPVRREIVELLSERPRTVREITDGLRISQSGVSQHLDVLRKAKLVTFEPRGASNVYRLDPDGLGALRGWLDRHWDKALANYARLFDDEGDDGAA